MALLLVATLTFQAVMELVALLTQPAIIRLLALVEHLFGGKVAEVASGSQPTQAATA